jgi:hypothetical protein
MAKESVTQLIEPIEGHGGDLITSFTLREPRAKEYMELGDPASIAQRDGTFFEVVNEDVIKKYIQACLIAPTFGEAARFTLADSIKMREVMTSFFQLAREKLRPVPLTPPPD